jgi:hypothetical protein
MLSNIESAAPGSVAEHHVVSEGICQRYQNLDENRPLRLEDAYAIASGELAVEAGAGFTLERRGPDRGFFPVEVLYGAYPNLQLGLGTTLSTDPHEIDEQTKSGDLQVSGRYNFNQETLTLPASGLKLASICPRAWTRQGSTWR